MRAFALSSVLSVCFLVTLAWSQTSAAQVLFQTTFNCPEWNQSMGIGDAAVCSSGDGITGNGGWVTSNGSADQITLAANNPAGGGGRGFRHWAGDGLNNAGGGIVVSWPPTPEMWFRYYVRFQPGFAWGGNIINMKTIYCNRGGDGTFFFGVFSGLVGGHVQHDQTNGGNKFSNVSWSQWQGGSTGDGNFHVLEVHVKMNSSGVSSDGVFEFWLDDTRIFSDSAVHFTNTNGTTFTDCAVGENHNNPQNGGVDAYVDFDDIVVSTAGYIGPIGSPRLPSPRNLRVQ